ncbi:hypothetical protein M569_11186 [Genlisea aurea]|uniref:Fucosyltransferase n=1 Tax=Genlisea aurea TaxID=192259 RepID=S8DL63_9LAMI|nr:hypothetical protein M569_11186 [Genlisea aurea]
MRYLIHPTNRVWGLIKRFYDAYLSNVDERVGIQLRILDPQSYLPSHILNHILSCSMTKGILPQINKEKQDIDNDEKKPSIAVLITTLTRGYYDEIRTMYWENPTMTGEVVAVHQPSFEEHQKSDDINHDTKALVEIYLLSLTDRLITSAYSTFGYVAQGLGGLRPWILNTKMNWTNTDQKCERGSSMEPCFHNPPYFDCEKRLPADPGALLPHFKPCEDTPSGTKLIFISVEMEKSVSGPPSFNGQNYTQWVVRMSAYMKGQNLWAAVSQTAEPAAPQNATPNQERNHLEDVARYRALDVIFTAKHVFARIMDCTTAKQAWDKIAEHFQESFTCF